MDMFGFWKKKEKEVPGVKCAKCGSENPAEAKFCLGCGANMEEQKSMKAKTDEATEITEDFKDKGGFWAKIIPGYHGYKKKEIRREADKLLRDHLVNRLAEAKKDINSIMEEAVESQPDILGNEGTCPGTARRCIGTWTSCCNTPLLNFFALPTRRTLS